MRRFLHDHRIHHGDNRIHHGNKTKDEAVYSHRHCRDRCYTDHLHMAFHHHFRASRVLFKSAVNYYPQLISGAMSEDEYRIAEYKPSFFVFENVTGLLSAKDEDGLFHFDKMRALFRTCGYSTEYKVLNSHDYGVFQNRNRIILIGKYGKKEKDFYPVIKKYDLSGLTVSEVLIDLPSLKAGEGTYLPVETKNYTGKYLYDVGIKDTSKVTFHIARPNTKQDLKIYRIAVREWNKNHKRIEYTDLPTELRTHNNTTSFLDRFKVVASDLDHSQTVVAHVARDGHYYIHPDINQNRSLTPREVARLQTFPDSYYFESKKDQPGRTAAYRQIGNAVPVRLAYCVAISMKKLLRKSGDK